MRTETAIALLLGAWMTAALSAAEVTRTLNLSGFARIDARNAFEVEIQRGETFRVDVRAEERAMDDLNIHTTGDRLVLERKRTGWRGWRDDHVHVAITMPDLREYNGSGATRGSISGFRTSSPFEIELSGASRLEAALDTGAMRVELSGASRLELRGSGRELRVDGSGASRAAMEEFRAESAVLHLSGASRAEIDTDGRIDLHASGASHVSYRGSPRLGTIDTSGASSIRARK